MSARKVSRQSASQGGVSAVAMSAATAGSTGPTSPNSDAELIAACEEYLRLNQAFIDACDAIPGDVPDDAPAWAIVEPVPALVERIVALRASTAEGYLARARCAALFNLPSAPCAQDERYTSREERFLAASMRDLIQQREEPST